MKLVPEQGWSHPEDLVPQNAPREDTGACQPRSSGNGKILERSKGQRSQISGQEHGRKEGRDTHRLRGTMKTGLCVNSLCGRGPRTPSPDKASQFSHQVSLYFSNLTGPTLPYKLFTFEKLRLETEDGKKSVYPSVITNTSASASWKGRLRVRWSSSEVYFHFINLLEILKLPNTWETSQRIWDENVRSGFACATQLSRPSPSTVVCSFPALVCVSDIN